MPLSSPPVLSDGFPQCWRQCSTDTGITLLAGWSMRRRPRLRLASAMCRNAEVFRDPSDLNVRIFYGSPQNAAILGPCRRFPLVLPVHGDCGGDTFQQWFSLPAEIARCGYVVAVTGYGGFLATGDPNETFALHGVYSWLWNNWEHRDSLMPPPATAIIGHSFGGTLAAQFIPEIPAQVFASLSGTFGQSPNFSALLSNINFPRLCCLNDDYNDAGVNAALTISSNGAQQL